MAGPIAFIEKKNPDFANISRLLARSATENRWTNFGPVWQALKEEIEALLELPAGRCAVPCASGTHALMAAAALWEQNGPVRWLVPDFGFRATTVGPFDGGVAIDCNAAGCIDDQVLEAIDRQSYDGVVALNPFGLLCNMDRLVDYARRHDKALIVDNAAGLLGFDRTDHRGVTECLSFHHTKPFGFGEGGCVIVDRARFEDACSALDFGYKGSWPHRRHALSNGKLSDPAAAFVLDRIGSAENWAGAYRQQFSRILAIARRNGFRLLVDESVLARGVFGHVPLLAPRPLPMAALANDILVVRKYYKPVRGLASSSHVYDHIVNVPCHGDVAALDDEAIGTMFRGLTGKA